MAVITNDNSRSVTVPNLSSDLYDIYTLMEVLKQKYTDIPEETLTMGLYGYFTEVHSIILENSTTMASNYMNEAVPTRAKYERNVIGHALSLGINKIMAKPAWIKAVITIPETSLIQNMTNDRFYLDCSMPIRFGSDGNEQFEFYLDYDIIIRRVITPTGEYVYTATYDMDNEEAKLNDISDIEYPYLPSVGLINYGERNFIAFEVVLREVTHNELYYKIISTNPLETKTFTFEWENQLAYFYVEVNESDGMGGTTQHFLRCLYDGLYGNDGEEYCNYLYVDENNIRIKFNRYSYQPIRDADITVHVFTTHGSKGNFQYVERINMEMESTRFNYRNMYCLVAPSSESQDGVDKMSVDYIRQAIPKQMLLRGSVTTYTDLNNYFNQLSTGFIRLYFLERIHNQEERLYFLYLLMKDDSNCIIPTNTMDVTVTKDMFWNVNTYNKSVKTGATYWYDGAECMGYSDMTEDEDIAYCDKHGFLYMCPFMAVVNKNPLFVSYYMMVLDYKRSLYYTYFNLDAPLQFVAEEPISVERHYFTDPDTFKVKVLLSQSIIAEYGLVTFDEDGNVISTEVKCMGVFYVDENPYRYCEAILTNYDDVRKMYEFTFTFKTNDLIDNTGRIRITKGIKMTATGIETNSYMKPNVAFSIFVFAKFDEEYGRTFGDIDYITMPNENKGYTLTNVFTMANGFDFFYDYSNIVGSYVDYVKTDTGAFVYKVKKMPLIRHTYINTEERFMHFVKILEKRRIYINNSLVVLEDSFGVDFKFFNTYGPSLTYRIDEATNDHLNAVNLTQTYEVKFQMPDDIQILPDITAFIKDYVENIDDIKDLHFSVLQGKVLEKFSEQLVYFQIYDVNGYGNDHQNFYKEDLEEFVEAHTVPEFINVNTLSNGLADITYRVVNNDGTIRYVSSV